MKGQPRRAQQTDENQQAIVHALNDIPGVEVEVVGQPLDLLVGYLGRNYLLEVKNVQGRNRLSKAQELFLCRWTGQASIVRSIDEALAAIGIG